MLGQFDAITMIAVRDLPTARRFYTETLGLTPHGPEHPTVATYKSGNATVNLYQSDYAGTNQATTALWVAGDQFDAVVDALRAGQVSFEQYDLPQGTREGDIHVFGELRVVWFKDPDGNILSVQNL